MVRQRRISASFQQLPHLSYHTHTHTDFQLLYSLMYCYDTRTTTTTTTSYVCIQRVGPAYRERTETCLNKKHLKNVGPIRHCEPLAPIHQVSLAVLSRAACASMSTTTTTTTTRDRGDRYGPTEWPKNASRHLSDCCQ